MRATYEGRGVESVTTTRVEGRRVWVRLDVLREEGL